MSDSQTGLLGTRNVAPGILWTQCMIHRESLTFKYLSAELCGGFDDVYMVKLIKRSSLNTHLFASQCQDLQSEHITLYHFEWSGGHLAA